jgi:carboxylesterase
MEPMQIMAGADSFLLKNGPRGVLLVHGFTGTPAEMRLLGEHLHAQGFTVLAIRLPGHGTSVQDMESTSWRHWYGAAIDGFQLLTGLCNEISVAGLSMGGLLALKLAAEFPIHRVVALSTPIFLMERRIPLLPLYRVFRRFVPKKRRDYEDTDPLYYVGYDSTPLSSLSSLLDLIEIVKVDLPSVHCPSLLVQSRREHTVRPESATFILEHLGAQQKELFWLKNSGHVVTVDFERETVFAKITDFLNSSISKE